MKKLWQKGESINELFERFTVGMDPELDVALAAYDVEGSKAHVRMLTTIGLLTEEEGAQLVKGLVAISVQVENGTFVIEDGVEDCHSQIELILTNQLGEVGKKIHSGRSRNDQVITALKLFAKDQLLEIASKVDELFKLWQEKSEENKGQLMPGYTHMQVAMPSSFGLWFGAHAESLVDDLILLKAAFDITNKNPLGSAAGYGSSFGLDREMTTKLMGFAEPNHNAVYAQMTRGKMEKVVAFAIASLASTLSKYAMDVCTYNGQDYGFFNLDTQFTTGSSIMPHKLNPDGFELVRAKCNKLQALPQELMLVLTNLTTGYHRDLQVLKESFMPAMQTMLDCLDVTILMTRGLEVKSDLLSDSKYDLLFTVEFVNDLVLKGTPFREAYQIVGKAVKEGTYKPDRNIKHTHLGSIGNLGNDQIAASFKSVYDSMLKERG
ncbi:MAG: argininosuccinate lyase [Cyclobacteriaceae bacterium]|jgi:argininosuccinate lyase